MRAIVSGGMRSPEPPVNSKKSYRIIVLSLITAEAPSTRSDALFFGVSRARYLVIRVPILPATASVAFSSGPMMTCGSDAREFRMN